VIYGHKDGLAMTFDVFEPESEANGAAVLFIVGGGWFSRWAPPEQTRTFYVWSTPNLEDKYRKFPGLVILKEEAKDVISRTAIVIDHPKTFLSEHSPARDKEDCYLMERKR
jgi:hypothetical protein